MRVPIAVTLESRNGGVTKDAVCRNALVEVKGEQASFRKRPGLTDLGLVSAGSPQLLAYWDDKIRAVVGDAILTAATSVIWNSSDKGAQITLSNGDLTVATTAAQNTSDGVRANVSKSSGSWYFEFVLPSSGVGATANISVGVADSTWGVTSDALGSSTKSISYRMDGAIRYNGSTIDAADAWANDDVIGVALIVGTSVSFYRNNVLQYTSTSIPVGAAWYPAAGGQGAGAAGSGTLVTSDFTYTEPSGYSHLGLGSATSGALSPTNAGLLFSSQDNGRNAPKPYLMFKNDSQAWTIDESNTVTQITDTDYPGKYAVSVTGITRSGTTATATTAVDTNFQAGSTVTVSGADQADYNIAATIISVGRSDGTTVTTPPVEITITRSGTTATATTVTEPHGYTNGQSVTITGAEQSEYNGAKTITWISPTSFSFTVTVSGQADTTATGTITTRAWWFGLNNVSNSFSAPADYTKFRAEVDRGNYYFSVGQSVELGFGLSTLTPYNGAQTITAVDGNSIEWTLSGHPASAIQPGSAASAKMASKSITSLTYAADTQLATATTSAAHGLSTGALMIIQGASPTFFNKELIAVTVTGTSTFTYPTGNAAISPATTATGTIRAYKSITTPAGPTFTFTVANSPTTPATGTITATGGRDTVPGIAYVDGYFAVMDINGVIYNSKEDDPTGWEALEYTIAQAESGAGKALVRSLYYLVALKEWTTEFFYNAKNEPPGSPFSPVENGFTQIGCANGYSVAHLDGRIYWMAQTKQNGRSVYVMLGTEQQKVSTPDVDRILNADDLATIYSFGLKLDGHSLYVLTMVTSNITLVYDASSQVWTQWSSLTLGSQVSVSTITRSGTTATVTTGSAHGRSDGDPVKISGANQAEYNGIFQISYVSTTVFTIEVTGSPASGSGTILMYPYTETYFKFPYAANLGGIDALLHESDGHLYKLDSTVYQDNAIPINVFARTARMDGGSINPKKMSRVFVIGDKASDTLMLRWSDDDSATFSAYRRVTLSDERPNIRRCGAFKRRSMELRHTGNTAPNLSALELEVGQ